MIIKLKILRELYEILNLLKLILIEITGNTDYDIFQINNQMIYVDWWNNFY